MEEKEYAGILVEPIPKWTELTRPKDEEINALLDLKIASLFTHYSLDPNDWVTLALKLAQQHVPGFRSPPKKKGRPAKRAGDDVTLFMHVELLRRSNKISRRKSIALIHDKKILSGAEGTLLARYKRSEGKLKPLKVLFDNITADKGKDQFLSLLEEALNEDKKEIISSPV